MDKTKKAQQLEQKIKFEATKQKIQVKEVRLKKNTETRPNNTDKTGRSKTTKKFYQ